MKYCLYDIIFNRISDIFESSGLEGYVIGGWVRDCILGRQRKYKDIDIVVAGDGIKAAKRIARELKPGIKVTVYKNFGTAMFKYRDWEFEFVGARKESYRSDSRKPQVETGTLEDDQKRRDFTVNALAISLNKKNFGELIDPFNGLKDLNNKIIRTPLDPDRTFSDDPLRMMRAIRFATQLDFVIEPETYDSIRRNSERIKIVSMERITGELNKILMSPHPSTGFNALYECNLLLNFFPELHNLKGIDTKDNRSHKDNLDHTLQVLDNICTKSSNIWLRWAALIHDIAKPLTKKYIEGTGWAFHGHEYIGSAMVPEIFNKLRLPMNDKMRYVKKLVLLHLRPITLSQEQITDSAIRRLLIEAGDDIEDLMTLCEADITSKNETKVKRHLKNFGLVRSKLQQIEEKDHIRNFQPPVDGSEIIKIFGIKPGKTVGILKSAIKEAILDGIIPNNYEDARKFLLEKASEMGLEPTDKN